MRLVIHNVEFSIADGHLDLTVDDLDRVHAIGDIGSCNCCNHNDRLRRRSRPKYGPTIGSRSRSTEPADSKLVMPASSPRSRTTPPARWWQQPTGHGAASSSTIGSGRGPGTRSSWVRVGWCDRAGRAWGYGIRCGRFRGASRGRFGRALRSWPGPEFRR
jgi:hypothetical protein